jgi:hypothetical protein
MPDESEDQPAYLHRSRAPDPLASAILAQVGLQGSAAFRGPQQREAEAALRSPAWAVRAAAVQALAERGERAPVEPLVAALRDEHAAVRAAAARALGRLGNRTPVEPLVAALRDPRWQVRTTAALSLGRLKQRTPVEPLVLAMNDADESVRAAAAWALGRLGQRTPVEPLVAALGDSAWPVREAAALALRTLGRRVPAALLLTAQMDEDRQVREAAGWALEARFGPPPGSYAERNRTMSQQIDFDQQRAYQDPREYQDALYQAPSGYAGPRPSLFGMLAGHLGTTEPVPAHHRVTVALGSLVTLLAVLVTLAAALHATDSGFVFLAALIALAMICATIVAINFAFNFRR